MIVQDIATNVLLHTYQGDMGSSSDGREETIVASNAYSVYISSQSLGCISLPRGASQGGS